MSASEVAHEGPAGAEVKPEEGDLGGDVDDWGGGEGGREGGRKGGRKR